MHIASLVDFEFDATGFDFPHRLGGVIGHSARLGVWHQTARTEHTTETTHAPHRIGRSDRHVEIEHAAFDLLQGLVIVSDDIGAGGAGCGSALARGEDEHAHGLTEAVRQQDHIADLLVSLNALQRVPTSLTEERISLSKLEVGDRIIIRNGEPMILEADKMSIGMYGEEEILFTNKQINLEDGDNIYLYSDGYYDQFGGPRGRKMLSATFRKYLLEIHAKPMNEQRQAVEDFYKKWRGHNEQIDDVMVIGLRFKS